MRWQSVFILILIFLVVCIACSEKESVRMSMRLLSWDRLIDSIPGQVSDSLLTVNPYLMVRANRVYWCLLKVISDDKIYVDFKNDSLIRYVNDYYATREPKCDNHIRALTYLGIVRTRMGINDTTVYGPLREASNLYKLKENPDPSLGYLINFFLGNIHYINRNYLSANDYFRVTLDYAHQEQNPVHLFDTYLALYWNEMEQERFEEGKLYLDTLSAFYDHLPHKYYFLLNAQSIYYDVIGEPEAALDREKAKLHLHRDPNENIELSRVYYNISNRYVGLNQLDSAMIYAQKAIDCIEDTTFIQNYLYYQNVANIACKQHNLVLSNEYLRRSFDMYVESTNTRLDTRIVELEKKYDLSESENDLLRARQQSLSIIIAALILSIILILFMMYAWRVKRNTRLKLIQAEYKMEQQEIQARILKEEAGKRKWLLQHYSNISGRLSFLQGEFASLTQYYISSNPKVHRKMESILKNTDSELRDITRSIATDHEAFMAYTHLKDDEGFFNTAEKMLLMLLACDADNRQLATFMNTSLESVRVRKSQLKRKMQENNMDTSLFNE